MFEDRMGRWRRLRTCEPGVGSGKTRIGELLKSAKHSVAANTHTLRESHAIGAGAGAVAHSLMPGSSSIQAYSAVDPGKTRQRFAGL